MKPLTFKPLQLKVKTTTLITLCYSAYKNLLDLYTKSPAPYGIEEKFHYYKSLHWFFSLSDESHVIISFEDFAELHKTANPAEYKLSVTK